MKSLVELSPKDKLKILFDLFPMELTPFVIYILEATGAVRRTQILNKLLWDNTSMNYLQFRSMVDQLETSLFAYMNAKPDSPAQLCEILGNPEIFYWTQKSLLGYLCLETNLKFTLAHDLFFNPNPPHRAITDFYQILNN